MQEYFNLDIENNFILKAPQEINNKKGESALLPATYVDTNDHIDINKTSGPITIMTPPLRCSKVRVWPGKNDKYSKCTIELETTENEWRFTQFLMDIGDKCRYVITENAKKWFKYTFSASSMRDSYVNLSVQKNYKRNEEEKIKVQLGKLLLNDIDKQTAKSYRNQYLVLRLVFKGILVSNGTFSEVWRADQIFKARPLTNESDESDDYEDDYYEDIGETIAINSTSRVEPSSEKTHCEPSQTSQTELDQSKPELDLDQSKPELDLDQSNPELDLDQSNPEQNTVKQINLKSSTSKSEKVEPDSSEQEKSPTQFRIEKVEPEKVEPEEVEPEEVEIKEIKLIQIKKPKESEYKDKDSEKKGSSKAEHKKGSSKAEHKKDNKDKSASRHKKKRKIIMSNNRRRKW